MEAKFKIEVEITVTDEQMTDIMVTALEGGINYWCGKAKIVKLPTDNRITIASDVIAKGGVLKLYDLGSNDTWILDQEKLINGIKKYMAEENICSMEELIDNHDADVADKIIQYAIFKEQMFA